MSKRTFNGECSEAANCHYASGHHRKVLRHFLNCIKSSKFSNVKLNSDIRLVGELNKGAYYAIMLMTTIPPR